MIVATIYIPGVIVFGDLLSVLYKSPFQLIIAPRPAPGHIVASFLKQIAILGRKLEATNAAPMDGDHIFWNGMS
jgi:hypothetical protein